MAKKKKMHEIKVNVESGRTIRTHYDKEYDILNITWGSGKRIESSSEIKATTIFDFGEDGEILGLEVHGFKEALDDWGNTLNALFLNEHRAGKKKK